MAGSTQILDRRRAAENIGKVTNTMETVSAVRYRQYYRSWAEGIEFYDSLAQLAYLIIAAEHSIDHPLMENNASDTNAILVIGSDRGLCGGYNSNLFRLLNVHISMAERFAKKLKIYATGDKVIAYLNNRGIGIEGRFTDFDQVPSPAEAKEIADDFANQYLNGQIGRLGIVYTRFFSPASQKPQTLTVLPISELIDDLTTRATVMWPWELNFEDFLVSPSVGEIFDTLASLMLRTAISGCFLEAALSEHLTRVVAMRNATDNAEEMIESLTRQYNLSRQNQITTELLDIIGAAFIK
ncbi:MAG: ATP synthase F1 subunit gamma [candidate division Zixibacteria bacterium]